MAKNILEFPQAEILGENDFLHVIQGGLDKKMKYNAIPVATENSNGLMKKEYASKLSILSYYLLVHEERKTELSDNGLYFLINNNQGYAALFLVDAYNAHIIYQNGNSFSTIKEGDRVSFYRSKVNGPLFLYNGYTVDERIALSRF